MLFSNTGICCVQMLHVKMWRWIVLLFCDIIIKVHGYSDGIFPEACGSMSPHHTSKGRPFVPQNTTCPFTIDYDYDSNPEGPITVILKSKNEQTFQGFMLEARIPGENRAVGKFITLQHHQATLLTCFSLADSAVSQSNDQPKSSFRVNWTAGATMPSEIQFRATFVETFSVFWEGVNLTLSLNPPTLNSTAATAPTMPVMTTTNTPLTTTTSTNDTMESTTTTNTPLTTTTSTNDTMESTTTTTTTTATSIPKTTVSNTTHDHRSINETSVLLMTGDCVVEAVKVGISNVFTVWFAGGLFFRRLHRVSKFLTSTVCFTLEIVSVLLLCLRGPFNVPLLALMCSVMVINCIEFVLVCLPIGPSHELKEICDLSDKVCSFIHEFLTVAVIFVAVWETDICRTNITELWLRIVLIFLTVWIFLSAVFVFTFSPHKKAILGKSATGNNKGQQRIKNLSTRVVFACFIELFLDVGTAALLVAIIVGILTC